MRVELKPAQVEAVSKMHNGCILNGDVGSGKSITALAYFIKTVCKGSVDLSGKPCVPILEAPRDLVIITTAKKRNSGEWLLEAVRYDITSDPDSSLKGVVLTIDSWNNISKYKDRKDCFFIFDEQRVVGSGAWVKAFLDITKKNQWLLLSATPGDSWSDYIPVFVANGFYKNRTQFLEMHAVYSHYAKFPKIDRYVGTKKLSLYLQKILVLMPVPRHTIRHDHLISVDYDKDLYKKVWKDRWNIWKDQPIRETGELFYAMRRVTNTHSSRLSALETLFTRSPCH